MKKELVFKSYELKATTQKSYYRKAYVLEGSNGDVFLQSYDTIVCGVVGGVFSRFWDGYSVTTQNHINDFRRLQGLKTINKKEWENIPVIIDPVNYADHVNANMGNQFYGCGYCF